MIFLGRKRSQSTVRSGKVMQSSLWPEIKRASAILAKILCNWKVNKGMEVKVIDDQRSGSYSR